MMNKGFGGGGGGNFGGGGGGGGGGLCKNFASGSCTYGDRCRFVHPGQQTAAGGGGGGNSGGFRGGPGGGGGGGNFRNQGGPNQGGGGGGGPRNFQNQRRGPRPQNDVLCTYFLQGNCQRGDSCNNIHQYSLDFDIEGKLFENSKRIQGAVSMEIYQSNLSEGAIFALVCTTSNVYITKLPEGMCQEIFKMENITAMHYNRETSLLFVAYANKNKGYVKIFKDNGNGNFQEAVTSHDLHQKEIMAIQVQVANGNVIMLTAGKDDHIKAWAIGNDGKLDCIADGVSTACVYSIVFAGDNVVAGCEGGKVETFKIGGNGKEFIREKEFQIQPFDQNTQGAVYKLIYVDDVVYASSLASSNGQVTGKVGLISVTSTGKVCHLANLELPFGPTILECITQGDVIFIGDPMGALMFMDKEGFVEKGKAKLHKAPIKDIKQYDDWCLIMDENGIFSLWRVLDEKTAEENRQQYQNMKSGGGNMGGGNMGGGNMGGGNMMSGGMMGGGNMMGGGTMMGGGSMMGGGGMGGGWMN